MKIEKKDMKLENNYRKVEAMYRKGLAVEDIFRACRIGRLETYDLVQKIFALDMKKKGLA